MAGHSHAANVARRKGAVDAQRAKAFNRCARAIQSAVRQGGGDPDANLKLRYALEKARAANMPKDNIERVIKRALGEGAGSIEELVYEGYAPGGVALIVSCLTDNRNRTAADIKHLFEKRGGNLGGSQPRRSTTTAIGLDVRSSTSPARPYRSSCSRASCSVMSAAPSLMQGSRSAACSRLPTAAPCFSTRSAR
jgi:hypothetical protein